MTSNKGVVSPLAIVLALIILLGFVILLNFDSLWYHFHIAPEGESEIEVLVDRTNATKGTIEKLEMVAKWEAENIDYVYGIDLDFSLGGYAFYSINEKLKIRPIQSPYNNDPKWIAYYKVGGCGELASFFYEVAKRAGFEVRVVEDNGIDHAWVEVKINDSWVVADPTIYWLYVGDPKNNSGWNKLWFNNKSWYELWRFSRVVTRSQNGTILDLTANYTRIYNVTISIDPEVQNGILKVTTWKGSQERIVFYSTVNGSDNISLSLGNRIYKFELIEPTWYGVEKFGRKVCSIDEVEGKAIKLKIERERRTNNFYFHTGFLLGVSVSLALILAVMVCRRLLGKNYK
jgi:hypothetical protein